MTIRAYAAAKGNSWRAKSAEAAFTRSLDAFTLEFMRQMQDYPGAQPWKNPPPKSGPRKDGRRTGNYGRNWRVRNKTKTSREIVNDVPYAVWVGGRTDGSGPKQTANMAQRGWTSITTSRSAALAKMKAQLKDLNMNLS